jgi:AraC-like DNA-binding protein
MHFLNSYPYTKIQGEQFLSKVYRFDRKLLFMYRKQEYTSTHFIDTYASNWFVGMMPLKGKPVKIKSGNEEIILKPGTAIFLPKFSIIEWIVECGEYEWYAYMGDFELPLEIIENRFLFTPKSLNFPTTVSDFKKWMLENLKLSFPLVEQKTSSAVALQLKKIIDLYFLEDLQITQAAKKLKMSRVVLTRAFTRAYGLSPLQYRNKLRVFESLKSYSKFKKISSIYSSSGFNNQGQYIKNFRNYLGVKPKTYDGEKINAIQ